MQPIVATLASLIRTFLIEPTLAIAALIYRLIALFEVARARGELPGRRSRDADSNCIPIRHPAFHRPDPLIYAQYYLMSLGLAVTWDNPDIELRRNGVAVSSSLVQPDTDYEIVARVWNG